MELIIEELPKMPTICLNMIVKNESKIITRLFDSYFIPFRFLLYL